MIKGMCVCECRVKAGATMVTCGSAGHHVLEGWVVPVSWKIQPCSGDAQRHLPVPPKAKDWVKVKWEIPVFRDIPEISCQPRASAETKLLRVLGGICVHFVSTWSGGERGGYFQEARSQTTWIQILALPFSNCMILQLPLTLHKEC